MQGHRALDILVISVYVFLGAFSLAIKAIKLKDK